ncbi:MAG TPA: phosphatidate cytidylyltransferase [Nevskiaceae bacterium]|nr:phosphatidate cytidylyltransferase [Nevskiaceae bacterium]
MLLQRVVTALVLLPLLLAAVWWAPTPWLYALFCAVAMVMAWEWSALMKWTQPARRWSYLAISAVLLAAAWLIPQRELLLPWLLGLAALWWIAAVLILARYPDNFAQRPPADWWMAPLGVLMMLSTMLSLARLHAMPAMHPHGGALKLLYFFFIVFCADTGAYFAGRAFGKHKLAPKVSPGKTVEGAIGGFALVALWAATAGVWVFDVHGADTALLVVLSLLVAVISIVGDLTESMFKRIAGVKDSGTILPGHGGILDRVDSILAAAPVMVLGLLLTGL